MAGTAAGQAIAILAAPLLTRVYTPEEFGAFGVYLAIVSVAAVVVALRYDAALPIPDGDEDAVDLLALAGLTTIAMSLVVGVGIWLIADRLITDPSTPVQVLAWLIPLGLLLTGFQQILTFWATRREAFVENARSNLLQGATLSGAQLLLGVLGAGASGMGAGYVLARVSGVCALAPTVDATHRHLLRHVTAAGLRAAAVRHRRFPLFAMPASLLNSLSVQAPVLVLAALFEATVVGWYSITVRVLQLPGTIIGNAVGQVFYARVSQSDPAGRALATTMVYRSLVVLGTGPVILLVVAGSEIFAVVFGEAWRGAGDYARWLAPWLLLVFVTSPLATLAYVTERQRTELAFQAALLVTRIATLAAGAAIGGATLSIALYGTASAALWAVYLVWLLRLAGLGVAAPARYLLGEVVVAMLFATPLVLAVSVHAPTPVWLVVGAITLAGMLARSLRVVRKLASPQAGTLV